MNLVLGTSVIIAVIKNEAHKRRLIELTVAVQLCHRLRIYAYDAYVLACAIKNRCPLISLGSSLVDTARKAGIEVLEVTL